MAKMKLHFLIKFVIIAICILIIGAFVFVRVSNNDVKTLNEKIAEYCNRNSEMKLSDITNFEWDTAYIDREAYMSGQEIAKTYGIVGEFIQIDSDYLYRIAFCKDKKLVCDLIVAVFHVDFEPSVKVIYPDTVFSVEMRSFDENEPQYPYLLPK
jgi:hypothetical protein